MIDPAQPAPSAPMSSVGPWSIPLVPLRDILPPQVPYQIRDAVPRDVLVPAGPVQFRP